MAWKDWKEQARVRADAARAWSGRQWERVRARTAAGWRKTRAAPWARIGLWTGGAVGALVVAFVLFLTFADWNALKSPIQRMASNATGREIVISGDLDVNPWSLTPEVRVEGLRIGNPRRYAERGVFATVADADASFRLLPLLIGRLDIVRIDLQGADIALYRNAEGVSNWSSDNTSGEPFDLPAIRRFTLRDGRVRLEDDKRRMTLDATFNSDESTDDGDRGQFQLAGDGRINGRPFTVELTGAALINVRRDRPYRFVADVRAGDTRLQAEGALRRPFDLAQFDAKVDASGPDLADLYYLLGLTLPNTPPYHLSGQVSRRGARYGMTEISGRVGDSDLSGEFTVTRQANDRPFLEGDFRTRSLDFDDMIAVLGGPPSTASGETASPEQRAEAAQLANEGRLLPDARLGVSRVRNMDARVSYRAARVRARTLPLRGLSVDVALDNGLLTLDPVTLSLNQGRISGSAAINAREDTPRVDLDVRLTNARLESFLPIGDGNPALSGVLHGRARLSGRGAAVREAAANAHGAVSFVVPRGEIREAFAELTGVNVVRGLGLLLTEDQSKIDVRCGVASFEVRNGVMEARNFVVDTETMLINGRGRVNLRDESLDLRIEGEPKEARLISIAAPIAITGRLRSPHVGIDADDAAGQGGIAAALATLVAPLAAVLPFVDVGLAEDADCAALMAEGRRPTRDS